MAKKTSSNIHLKHNEAVYTFLNISIEDANDGSVYVSLMRQGNSDNSFIQTDEGYERVIHDQPRNKKKRLSYHASGCVIYHDTNISSNYFEPVSCITQVNAIALWSVPAVNSLDLCDLVKDTDHVIDIGLPDGRVNFEILIAPNDFVPEEPHFSVRYEGLLSVIVVLRPEITVPIDLKDAFIVLGPKAGLFEEQQLDNQDALIKFHQKLNSTQDLVLYSPNGAGVSKIITAVKMRCAPKIDIQFESEGQDFEIVSANEHVILFKVKNQHGHYIKTPVPIRAIILDSEL